MGGREVQTCPVLNQGTGIAGWSKADPTVLTRNRQQCAARGQHHRRGIGLDDDIDLLADAADVT